MIVDRLKELRKEMGKDEIDYYIIPSSDAHQSEYVPDYYKGREFISGFTGSAGTLLVGKEQAFLWTDGRYFIQAATELKGSGIKLMKMSTPGYETIEEWIKINIKKGEILAFDGEVISTKNYKKYEELAEINEFNLKSNKDILIDIWNSRSQMPKEEIFIHEIRFAGKSAKEKISEVRRKMKDLGGENYIITSLDDIAWLFNIRGSDIAYNPVTLSYALITVDQAILYVDNSKINEEVSKKLKSEGVIIREYTDIFKDVKKIEDSVIIDTSKVNAKIYLLISKRINIIEYANITTELKAIKNKIEIKNIEAAQIRDGVAMVKFIKWLKENVKDLEINEVSAADKLEKLRAEGENFKGLSFNTIAGYKDHAAMMHYAATENSKYTLKPEGMFLVDSGAQYLDGTTDITRTFILGNLTEEEKRDFTLVLKGHIALSSANFLRGATGENLDVLARRPLWDKGIDYKCGTGHGVGFFLSVHEGPQSFRQVGNNTVLKPGMIITNEPGVYKKDKHGIRTENILLVTKASNDEDMGEFYKFDTISYCPIDLQGIYVDMLNKEEERWLNQYHKMVYDKLSGYLNNEEKEFLKLETREV